MSKRNILSLLAPQTCMVEIVEVVGYDNDNKAIRQVGAEVEIMPLTWHEWEAIGAMLENPRVPTTKRDGKTVPDPNDPDYVLACREADRLRDAMRVCRALVKAGHTISGSGLEEQAEAFMEQASLGAAYALLGFLRLAFQAGGRAREDAGNFHGLSKNSGPDMPPDDVDAGDVVDPAGS